MCDNCEIVQITSQIIQAQTYYLVGLKSYAHMY